MTRQLITKIVAAFIVLAIVGYLLVEWIVFLQRIDEVNRSELIGFVSFVASYLALLSVLVFLGWVVFKIRDYALSRHYAFSKPARLALYLVVFLAFYKIVSQTFVQDDQFIPEHMLLAGVGIAIVIISEKLFSASKQKQVRLTQEKERQEAELTMIKSQVNPHFLFNALNTLYNEALKIEAHNMTTNLEKLTDILRYQLQYASNPFISLGEEANFLQQFVDFHKNRFKSEESVSINLDVTINNKEALIRPMILITFVENAFKHGISHEKPSIIDILLKEDEREISLQVANSNHPKVGKMSTGIGLPQTKKMLNAYYPNHQLTAEVIDDTYQVDLKLTLSSNHR